MTQPTAILVTGMHRSGTSATAGALRLAGVALGRNLLPPGSDNPKGYFESERAVAINERLLARLGSRWDDVRALPEGWVQGEAAREALRDIEALLDAEFAGAPLWALKDPRLCRLMPIWREALLGRNIRTTALFVVRHPVQVAASIQARNGWAPALGELLWLRYMLEAEEGTRGIPRTAIAYDALLKDPLSTLKLATRRIDIKLPKRKADTLEDFIDSSDRHQRQRRKTVETGPFAKIVMEVHDALMQVAQGEDAWARIEAMQEEFAREWAGVGRDIDAVATMAAALDASASAAREASAKVASDLHAQLEWARSAVEKEETLAAENARLRQDLSSQIEWSQLAVKEREALQAELATVRSDLSAQMAWSESAVAERELLQAENARLNSELSAQVTWAEQAVQERETLQEELARANSALTAQLKWSEEAVALQEALQAEVAHLRSELAAQVAWAEQAVREREAEQEQAVRERKALQAEVARLGSELSAQLAWSENAVQEREALQARLAHADSELAAQLAWAGQAVEQREALQAEVARLGSELSAQVAWSKQAVQEREALQAELGRAKSELAAQVAWSERAVHEREELQAQLARVNSELSAQVAWSERAVQEREELQAREASLRSELAAQVGWAEAAVADWRRRTEGYEQAIASAEARSEELGRALDEIRATISWRVTRPFRVTAHKFRKKDKGSGPPR